MSIFRKQKINLIQSDTHAGVKKPWTSTIGLMPIVPEISGEMEEEKNPSKIEKQKSKSMNLRR